MTEQFLTLMADLDSDSQKRMIGWYDLMREAGFTSTQTQGFRFELSGNKKERDGTE